MRFTTIFFVLACGAMALAAAITPDALINRADTDISQVINILDKRCDELLPQFDTCQDSECTETLVLDIVEIVTAATSAIANLKDILSFNLAKKIAEIVVKIVVKLDYHKTACNGMCGDLSVYTKIDLGFSLFLKQFLTRVSGILTFVGTLLLQLAAILKNLDLKLTLKVCLEV